MESNRRTLLQASVQRHWGRHAIESMQASRAAHAEKAEDYLRRLREDHYPRYRDLVKLLNGFLKDEAGFEFTEEVLQKIADPSAL